MSIISSADGYALAEGSYIDPNRPSPPKHTQELPQDDYHQGYAHMIQQFSRANIGSTSEPSGSNAASPEASHTPSRTSSEGHTHEAQTPPEPASFQSYSERCAGADLLSSHDRQLLHQRLQKATRTTDLEYLQQGPRPGLYSLQRQHYGNGSDIEVISDRLAPAFGPWNSFKGKSPMPTPDGWRSPASGQSSPTQSRRPSAVKSASSTSEGDDRPFTKLSHHDIVFKATTRPEPNLNSVECRDILADAFPTICSAPVRQFDEDGTPLPPTKRHETSPEEREARKEALAISFVGKTRLSLIKAMVVLESRSGSWKRIGSAMHPSAAATASSPASALNHSASQRLPPMPSPWTIELQHQDLDVATSKPRSKNVFELPGCRQDACCHKCSGQGTEKCGTCCGEVADECFWCAGTGKEKGVTLCKRCHGERILKCTACNGSLVSKCKTCDGQGSGHYAYFVEVKVKRVEMPTVAVSALVALANPSAETVRSAAIMRLLESTQRLAEAGSTKSKPYVPVMAACGWETSVSHIVEVRVPLSARFKKGAKPALRPEGLSRKIPFATRFFSMPSDPDLRPTELTREEVERSKLELSPFEAAVSRSSLAPAPPSEPVTPAAREFVPRPSPLSQLVLSPGPATPVGGTGGRQTESADYLSRPPIGADQPRRTSHSKLLAKLHLGVAV